MSDKYYAISSENTLFTNENKGPSFLTGSFYNNKFSTYQSGFACTVGELRQALFGYRENDLVFFSGSDDSDSDYPPYTDSRGITITSVREFTADEYNEAATLIENEQKKREERDANIAKREEENERAIYEKLKQKFEHP